MKISDEQMEIFHHIKEGKNVIVDSIAGSGKSTTIIHIAQLLPEKKFLHITYNSMLRKEFKEKVQSLKIENIDVHTYHSFAVKYFNHSAYTDTGIREILATLTPPTNERQFHYEILVVDECQDMTKLYFYFLTYFLRFFKTNPQLLFLGDYMQCLYEFKGADSRFLTLADEIWSGALPSLSSQPLPPKNSFVRCSLKTSYRITNQMASFVNNAMLGESRMNACRSECPVIYIRNTRTTIERIVINLINRILNEGDLPSDIFILAPSVKGTFSNVRRLENALVESGIPCHVPMVENERITDERVIDGKIVFSTFHSVKGRQRKYVFVMNFDNSYFTFNARNLSPQACPNTLYVATTRATHKLFLLEMNQKITDRPLDFLKMTHTQMNQVDYIDFKGVAQEVFYMRETNEHEQEQSGKKRVRYITPTDLIKFIPENVIEILTPLLKKIIITEISVPRFSPEEDPATPTTPTPIIVPNIIMVKKHEKHTVVSSYFTPHNLYEDVTDLNGIAIPAIYCDHILRKSGVDTKTTPNILWKFIKHAKDQLKEGEYPYLKRLFETLSPICQTPSEYLYLSNVFIAFQEKLYFKLNQIKEYDWLSEEMANKCIERMDDILVGHDTYTADTIESFENTIIHSSNDDEHLFIDELLESLEDKYRFTARVDLITTRNIWELKFVNSLTMDHQLQFVLYAWLWKCTHRENVSTNKEFRILNVKTGEVQRLNATFDELTEIVVHLIRGKYTQEEVMPDEEFIQSLKC